MTGMTKSMHDLAQRGGSTGYSAGYMQGFRDGNSGIFGDRITDSLLRRLEDQYPGQDEFKKGYIDGFKEGASNKSRWEDSRRLQQSLTELTERLASYERAKGDEIHSTKIYHVCKDPNIVSNLFKITSNRKRLATAVLANVWRTNSKKSHPNLVVALSENTTL